MPVLSAIMTSASVKRRIVAAMAPPITSKRLGTSTKAMKSPPRKIATSTTAVPLPSPISVARSMADSPTFQKGVPARISRPRPSEPTLGGLALACGRIAIG
jgi:hypothetical protein